MTRSKPSMRGSLLGALAFALLAFDAPLALGQAVRVDVSASAPPPVAAPAPPPPAAAAPVAPPRPVVVSATVAPPPPRPVVLAARAPDGQWVWDQHYGWLYLPYAPRFTYVPPTGYPMMFVYYPAYGWRWLSAPWVYGVGPIPYWGPRGYVRFAWYARPWFVRPRLYRRAFRRVYVLR